MCSIMMCLFLVMEVLAGDAMFGLKWGDSPMALKRAGLEMEKKFASGNLHLYKCDSLPKNLSTTESYSLIFDDNVSLVKIVVISKTIEGDIYGTEGKDQFDKLVRMLKSKGYRVEKEYQKSGMELYKDEDEFYQCLKYEGCGVWYALLEDSTHNIGVELKGLNRGEGYIQMDVEAIPGFKAAINKRDQKRNSSDADALGN